MAGSLPQTHRNRNLLLQSSLQDRPTPRARPWTNTPSWALHWLALCCVASKPLPGPAWTTASQVRCCCYSWEGRVPVPLQRQVAADTLLPGGSL